MGESGGGFRIYRSKYPQVVPVDIPVAPLTRGGEYPSKVPSLPLTTQKGAIPSNMAPSGGIYAPQTASVVAVDAVPFAAASVVATSINTESGATHERSESTSSVSNAPLDAIPLPDFISAPMPPGEVVQAMP